MEWLMARAKEPSTWKGIGWILVAAGVLPAGSVEGLAAAGVAIVGAVEMMRKEK